MVELFRKHYPPPGTAPGTLRETRPTQAPGARISLAFRDQGLWTPMQPTEWDQVPLTDTLESLHWFHVDGMPTASELALLGERLGLHPLAMEDVLNGGQRPKVDRYDELLVVTLGVTAEDAEGALHIHQLTLFMGGRFVLSVITDGMDVFPAIRRRLRDHGRALAQADELLHALMDAAVDHAFPVLDAVGERIEQIEESMLDRPDQDTLERLHRLRRELIVLRRHLWPMRDALNQILRDHSDLMLPETRVWMRDIYDHAVQVMDLVESYRDMAGSLLDIYLSTMSNRLNETIRQLTLIATIFMPLTFVAGIYGMNFEHPHSPFAMPELGWYLGYPLILLIMLLVAGGMLWWFRRKRWF